MTALALASASACAAGDAETEDEGSHDLDVDPDVLDQFDDKSDTDPCAAFPGGMLAGDDPLVLVNKQAAQKLRSDWKPPVLSAIDSALMMPGRTGELRPAALAAFKELRRAAKDEDGITLGIRSAYRSFRVQCITFAVKVQEHGLEHARRFSAEPGRSQHQLGTTADISSPRLGFALEQSMGDAPEGIWLADNAHRFGFAISYPRNSEEITGYGYEPWHLRYIGRDAATELAGSGLILEEYLRACDDQMPGLLCPREPGLD
jgi:D-alanyl-D-alanine carboxypeptidase